MRDISCRKFAVRSKRPLSVRIQICRAWILTSVAICAEPRTCRSCGDEYDVCSHGPSRSVSCCGVWAVCLAFTCLRHTRSVDLLCTARLAEGFQWYVVSIGLALWRPAFLAVQVKDMKTKGCVPKCRPAEHEQQLRYARSAMGPAGPVRAFKA